MFCQPHVHFRFFQCHFLLSPLLFLLLLLLLLLLPSSLSSQGHNLSSACLNVPHTCQACQPRGYVGLSYEREPMFVSSCPPDTCFHLWFCSPVFLCVVVESWCLGVIFWTLILSNSFFLSHSLSHSLSLSLSLSLSRSLYQPSEHIHLVSFYLHIPPFLPLL